MVTDPHDRLLSENATLFATTGSGFLATAANLPSSPSTDRRNLTLLLALARIMRYAGRDSFLRMSGENLTLQPPSLRRKGEPEGSSTPLWLPVEGFCLVVLTDFGLT